MSPLSLFAWTDGLSAKLTGMKKAKFYKEQTGESDLHISFLACN